MRLTLAVLAVTAGACGIALGGELSGDESNTGLDPILARIKKTRTVRVGYREASLPFSFVDRVGPADRLRHRVVWGDC